MCPTSRLATCDPALHGGRHRCGGGDGRPKAARMRSAWTRRGTSSPCPVVWPTSATPTTSASEPEWQGPVCLGTGPLQGTVTSRLKGPRPAWLRDRTATAYVSRGVGKLNHGLASLGMPICEPHKTLSQSILKEDVEGDRAPACTLSNMTFARCARTPRNGGEGCAVRQRTELRQACARYHSANACSSWSNSSSVKLLPRTGEIVRSVSSAAAAQDEPSGKSPQTEMPTWR